MKWRHPSAWLPAAVAALGFALAGPARALEPDSKPDGPVRQAEQAERTSQFERARDLYEQLFLQDRTRADFRAGWLRCHRIANLVQRHRDPSYREQLAGRDLRSALLLYREVQAKLRCYYPDPEKTEWGRLFQYGLDELTLALDNEVFRQERLPASVKPAAVSAFRQQLRDGWDGRPVQSQRELETEVTRVAQAGRAAIDLDPAVTVMEFACGACNGLDEYTLYLTPAQLSELYAALDGETVGIGIDVTVRDQKVWVAEVYPGTPAALAGLGVGDRITQVDRKALADPPEHAVLERLRGSPGSLVELEFVPRGENRAQTLVLTRRLVHEPSVVQAQILTDQPGIGYCRVTSFQKTTAQELDDGLVHLQMQGMRALILDLRGNGGGYLAAAVQVTERFLPEGKVILTAQSLLPEQARVYRAGHAAAVGVPLVLLVDAETASAAEVVAAALQAHRRATLVGQPTFGKWSVQRVFELKAARGGLRVTLARFLAPGAEPYGDRGIVPDVLEERSPLSASDGQLLVAVQVAIRLANMRP
jgi:carboxyl-terminal processing protease